MPKFNKGDKVRIRLTVHSPYRGQTGVVDGNPENFSSSSTGSSGLWYMVRFEWKGLHPAVRFKEEDLESPDVEMVPEEASSTVVPAPQSWWARMMPQPALRKYYIAAAVAVLAVVGIIIGVIIGNDHGLPTRPDYTLNQTQLPGLTEGTTTSKLAFTSTLVDARAGFDFTVQPEVKILDKEGNIITDSAAEVTLLVTDHKAVLYGTTTVNAVNGVATFTDLNIRSAGSNYTLTAISSGSTSTLSNSFNITSSPAIVLGFSGDPIGSGLENTFTVTVTVMDLFWNIATDSTAEVTISLADNSSASGAVLSGTTTQKAKNGVVTFSYLSIDPPDGKYKLVATSPGMISATSDSFNPIKVETPTATQ
jgi:hypothetical protein